MLIVFFAFSIIFADVHIISQRIAIDMQRDEQTPVRLQTITMLHNERNGTIYFLQLCYSLNIYHYMGYLAITNC
jgi:hypothetical protein